MKIKYFAERTLNNGTKVYQVKPPKYVTEAIGATYQQFSDRDTAIQHAMHVADQYQEYKRNKDGVQFVDQTTVEGLFRFYFTQPEFTDKAPSTKAHYRYCFKQLMDLRIGSSNKTVGQMFSRNVTVTHVRSIYSDYKDTHSHGMANQMLAVARLVWNVGLSHGKVSFNPWLKARVKAAPAREVVWEQEQVETFIAKADEMGLSSIGTWALLGYHFCQRPGDMLDLRWGNLKGGAARFKQQKTGTKMVIDLTPDLEERLAQLEPGGPDDHILINPNTGLPWARSTANHWFGEIRKAAGLPEGLWLADLRRTGATELAEAGGTEDEIRSVTGHQSRDLLKIYVRPTDKIARNAMNKRFSKPTDNQPNQRG